MEGSIGRQREACASTQGPEQAEQGPRREHARREMRSVHSECWPRSPALTACCLEAMRRDHPAGGPIPMPQPRAEWARGSAHATASALVSALKAQPKHLPTHQRCVNDALLSNHPTPRHC
eukprot:365910-Chlamydomonas_euryale.AAC.36